MLRWRQMWAVPLRAVMNRADRGLYGGKEILFGNNVSHSMRHTRRTWKPNVQVSARRNEGRVAEVF